MKNYTHIFFDLDGTLTDSSPGITNAVLFALKSLGYPIVSKEELYCFIGPPLTDMFREKFNMSDKTVYEAVHFFRSYYNDKGKFENSLYDGIANTLSTLKENGKKLFIATSKPQHFAEQILSHFGVLEYFDFVSGATPDGQTENARATKHEVLLYLMNNIGQVKKSDIILVGDTKYDVIGANELRIDCLGVTYGFGSKDELLENGAVALAHTPYEITQLLL